MPTIGMELGVLLVLLGLNGLLAMSEMAVVSARKTRLQQRAGSGDESAAAALALANDPGRFLATVQIGITGIGIVAGAFGGSTLSKELSSFLRTVPALEPYSEPVSFGVVVIGITYLSLVIGELIPKQVALANPERIASLVARPMRLLSGPAAPIVWLLNLSTEAILRLIRVPRHSQAEVSDDEIRLLIQQGTDGGSVAPIEQDLMEGAIDLGDQLVCELMTPRPRVVWLDVEDPPEENWRKIATSTHSLFPVCEGELDTVLGVVSLRELWLSLARGESIDLRTASLTPPLYVWERQPALKLFEVFQPGAAELALVIDERGSVEGVVSLTDLMEALVGDAALVGKRREYQPVQRSDGSWLLDGLMPIDQASELLGINGAATNSGRYQSLGGLVFTLMGRVPATGEAVEWDGWRFEVIDMDGNRIDKILASC